MIGERPTSPTMNKSKVMMSKDGPPRRRLVQFSLLVEDKENTTIVPYRAKPMKELTIDISRDMWYTNDEIKTFRKNAKDLVVRRLRRPARPNTVTNAGEDLTGLERYFDTKRTKHKKSAIYYIIKSQSFNKDPEFTREVSRRCSSFAKNVAAKQGFEDFCNVYDPLASLFVGNTNNINDNNVSSQISSSPSIENYNDYFFKEESSKPSEKRSNSHLDENNVLGAADGRRVRQRITMSPAA